MPIFSTTLKSLATHVIIPIIFSVPSPTVASGCDGIWGEIQKLYADGEVPLRNSIRFEFFTGGNDVVPRRGDRAGYITPAGGSTLFENLLATLRRNNNQQTRLNTELAATKPTNIQLYPLFFKPNNLKLWTHPRLGTTPNPFETVVSWLERLKVLDPRLEHLARIALTRPEVKLAQLLYHLRTYRNAGFDIALVDLIRNDYESEAIRVANNSLGKRPIPTTGGTDHAVAYTLPGVPALTRPIEPHETKILQTLAQKTPEGTFFSADKALAFFRFLELYSREKHVLLMRALQSDENGPQVGSKYKWERISKAIHHPEFDFRSSDRCFNVVDSALEEYRFGGALTEPIYHREVTQTENGIFEKLRLKNAPRRNSLGTSDSVESASIENDVREALGWLKRLEQISEWQYKRALEALNKIHSIKDLHAFFHREITSDLDDIAILQNMERYTTGSSRLHFRDKKLEIFFRGAAFNATDENLQRDAGYASWSMEASKVRTILQLLANVSVSHPLNLKASGAKFQSPDGDIYWIPINSTQSLFFKYRNDRISDIHLSPDE